MATPTLVTPAPPRPRAKAAARNRIGWLVALAAALGIVLSVQTDLRRLRTVAELATQGSTPPARDAASPTGYVAHQRHFLGAQERGETYRWIAATQQAVETGVVSRAPYTRDTIPDGRPMLAPTGFTLWLTALAWIARGFTGTLPLPAIEAVALVEPLLAHMLAIVGAILLIGRRFGRNHGALAGLAVACLPAIAEQFLPGVLTPRTWALLLGGCATGSAFLWSDRRAGHPPSGATLNAVAAAMSLWLDPAIGFPVVLLIAGAALASRGTAAVHWLRWAGAGSAIVLLAWWIDRAPGSLAPGELRYVHPLYALAWCGLGLLLHGFSHQQRDPSRRGPSWLPVSAGALLFCLAGGIQLRSGFSGWLHPAAPMRRLSSLHEGVPAADHFFGWIRAVAGPDVGATLIPLAFTGALLAWTTWAGRRNPAQRRWTIFAVLLFGGLVGFAFFRVRAFVLLTLASIPLSVRLYRELTPGARRASQLVAGMGLVVLLLWRGLTTAGYATHVNDGNARAHVEALIFRHFSQWLATHAPAGAVTALAPPQLSDSLVFHGDARVLISTAWESHPGHVAASRILSAPDWNEPEGILRNRGINHIVVPSWDPVMPQLVRAAEKHRGETFHARLQRWVLPPYLRPIPYHLPPSVGFEGQVILVLRLTEPQDEALALSRLAEYFVEMRRDYLANAAGRILGQSFRDDPNAAIARALVLHEAGDQAAFVAEISRLADLSLAARNSLAWDRRVQRAIALALGGRHELARAALGECLAEMDASRLHDLTSLQAFRLLKLADAYRISFPHRDLQDLARTLCREYGATSATPAKS